MALLSKTFLIFWISASVHFPAFSQSENSAQDFFNEGKRLESTDINKAFTAFQTAVNKATKTDDWELYLQIVNHVVSLDFEEEQEERVFEWSKDGLDKLKRHKATDGIAQLHFNVGNFYADLTNDVDKPIYHFETARKIWAVLFGEMSEKVANCYHAVADIYKYSKNDFQEAETKYEKALQIRESIKSQDLKVLFRTYYSLAQTNNSQQDFEKALSYATKTLETAKKLEGSIYQETTHGVLAGIFRDMGQSSQAREHYNIAIELNDQKNLRTLAWYYQGLGETLRNDSQYVDAIKNLQKAHTIYVKQKVNAGLLVYLLKIIADTYDKMDDERNFYKTTLKLFVAFDSLDIMRSRQASQGFMVMGNFHLRRNRFDSALYYYQNALISSIRNFNSKKIEDNPTEAMIGFQYYVNGILSKKAAALKGKFTRSKDSRYWHQALACLRLSERLLSQERNTLDMQDAQWEFTETNYDIYEDIISLLYEDKQFIPNDSLQYLAFQYFERSKARSLTDALAETERSEHISRNDSLLNLHATLRRNLLAAQDKLSTELEQKNNAEKIVALREEIISIDKSIHACKVSIEQKYPGYFNVKYGYQPTSLEKLHVLTMQDEKVMLEYFSGDEWVYVLGIGDGKISFKRVGKTDSIKSMIDETMVHLSRSKVMVDQQAFESFTTNAWLLHKRLVAPFHEMLTGKKRIQIIPDGAINQLPFEVLLEKKATAGPVNYRSLQYMIRSYAIGYAYSSFMLINNSRKVLTDPSVLGVGFTEGDKLQNADARMANIEGAKEELQLLSQRFANGKFLIGNDATEGNFKMLSPDFDILHLAIHGAGDVTRNFAASLYFKPKGDAANDGELHAYELYGLKLKASLAVLTACESGLGKGYKGEGMISIASAFATSGCDNILMSLWKVNDQLSIGIMTSFYDQLENGMTIDDALRVAKLHYLESADEITADPKFWATMVAYGSLDKVYNKDKGILFKIALSSILLFVLLLVLKIQKNR